MFGPDETYYEHDGEIYCHVHYSLRHAVRCGGCNMAILKQFVEVKMGSGASGSGTALATTSAASEQWHPECYMIFKVGRQASDCA